MTMPSVQAELQNGLLSRTSGANLLLHSIKVSQKADSLCKAGLQ